MIGAHTPGPWVIDHRRDWDKEIGIRQSGNGWHRFACQVDYDDCDPCTAEANANLVAAAPDLLAAAEKLMRAADEGDADLGMDAHDELRAAIAKARGQ